MERERRIYSDNYGCWYALAGEIIKNAATETYRLQQRKAELEAEKKALFDRIMASTDSEWREEVSPLLLSIKISNQQLDNKLSSLKGHTDCDGIKSFRLKIGEDNVISEKLKERGSFFESSFYKTISLGLDAEKIVKETAHTIEAEEAWKYISKIETEDGIKFKIMPTPKQKLALSAAGHTGDFLFDDFATATKFRDEMVKFCQEQYRKKTK